MNGGGKKHIRLVNEEDMDQNNPQQSKTFLALWATVQSKFSSPPRRKADNSSVINVKKPKWKWLTTFVSIVVQMFLYLATTCEAKIELTEHQLVQLAKGIYFVKGISKKS